MPQELVRPQTVLRRAPLLPLVWVQAHHRRRPTAQLR